MERKFALTLVLCFAGGILLTAGLGGALGVFDRGPTERDVSDARERGLAEGRAEIELGKDEETKEQEELGFERGREALEWLTLDRLPNPDGWIAGVAAGRRQQERVSAEAYQAGYEDGEKQGREDGLMMFRSRGGTQPTAGEDQDPSDDSSQ